MARNADPLASRQVTSKAVPADEAFVVTVGVPSDPALRNAHCQRIQVVLRQAGYQCGPTSGDSILELARQEELTRELKANDPEDKAA